MLVTGAAGYLGAEIVRQLSSSHSEVEVVAFDNFSRNNFSFLMDRRVRGSSKLSVVIGDVLDHVSLRTAMEGCECVVHLAGILPEPGNRNTPHIFDQVNNWGTASLIRAANDVKPALVVFASSLMVYGTRSIPVTRDQHPSPNDAYGSSKFQAEKQFLGLNSETKFEILRLGNLYGLSAQTRFDSLVNRMVLDAKYLRKVFVQGSGSQRRPVAPVSLAASKLIDAALNPQPSSEPRIVATESPSLEDVASAIKKALPETEVQYVNRAVQMNSLQLSGELHIEDPKKTLSKMIPNMIGKLV